MPDIIQQKLPDLKLDAVLASKPIPEIGVVKKPVKSPNDFSIWPE
jgi:hypothetical protein